MIVEFPFFAAGINYFPHEISVLRIFEPRYLLLIGDSIQNNSTFCVGRSLDNLNEISSEVRIIDHQDISNAEQVVVVECINLIEVTNINLENEYPKASGELVIDIGLPPTEDELLSLEADIKRGIGKLIEQGLDIELPIFEIDSANRILKLWELSAKLPMADETRNYLVSEREIVKRYSILKNYVQKINDTNF